MSCCGCANSKSMIQIEDLSKIYISEPPVVALDRVSMAVPLNSFAAITGTSGSGKSTLLNIIGTLARQTSGKIIIDNVEVSALGEKERAAFRSEKIGFVFQSFYVMAHVTAVQNVALPARFSRIKIGDVERRALRCLDKVGLSNKAGALCSKLSGGQLQRVAIARALFMNPPIILADEPTGNLDVKTGAEILELFSRLRREEGLTLLVVTHEEAAVKAADIVLKLENGKIIEG